MSDRYRVGRSLGRTIYRNDELIGIMDRPEDAAMIVDALNAIPPSGVSASENPAPVDVSWVTTEPPPKPLKRPKVWGVGLLIALLALCTIAGALIAEAVNRG